MSRVRLVPIIFVAIISLAVLFGGFQAYRHFNMLRPLEIHLQKISGVTSVNIETGQNGVVVVKLGPIDTLKNDDLQSTYQAINQQIEDTLGSDANIHLLDNENSTLEMAFENLNPTLMEGLVKADYKQMIISYEQQAKTLGIHARVTMDDHNIYIQMSQGKYYLYKIQPLHQGGVSS